MTQHAISRRPTLATGFVLLLFFLLVMAVFHALLSIAGDAIERLHDTEYELRQARALVNDSGKLQAELRAMDEVAIRRQLQTGDSALSAIGILQGNVNQLVRESGLQLDSMAAELPHIKGPMTELTIVLKANGSEAALIRLLAAIEKQDTLIVIQRLTVLAQDRMVAPNAPPAPGVGIEMRTSAYWTAPLAGRAMP